MRKYCQEDQCHPFITFHKITKGRLNLFQDHPTKGEAYRNALAQYAGGSGQTKTMNPTRQLWSQKYRPTKQAILESPYKQRDDSTQINITLTQSQLRSVIKEVVDRQVAPLMDRINYLQDQLNSLQEQKRHRKSRHSSKDSNDSDYSQQKETNFQSNTPPKTRKKFSEQCQAFQPKKSLDSSMKNVLIEQVNLRIDKLRKLVFQPSLREEWYRRLEKIKNIVIDRALRNRNFLKSSEKQKIISFIQYGVNIGLDKYFLIFLIGISRSSLENWTKEFK